MRELFDMPVFGIMISILAYELGLFIYKKTRLAIFNPLMLAMSMIIIFLLKFDISLEAYNKGGDLISFFLGPATVILAVPLYKQIHHLKANIIPIIGGITIGCITAVASVCFFAKIFQVSPAVVASLIPKSITTPIGIEVSRQLGGIPPITVAAIIITGIFGAVLGPWICKIFGIGDSIAIGISIGTSSHALGTTKAIEIGEIEGAMSSLAIGIAGIITVLIAPLIVQLL